MGPRADSVSFLVFGLRRENQVRTQDRESRFLEGSALGRVLVARVHGRAQAKLSGVFGTKKKV